MAEGWLYRYVDNAPHAYTSDGVTYALAATNEPWAQLSEGWLYDLRGNTPIGYLQDRVVTTQSGEALYYVPEG